MTLGRSGLIRRKCALHVARSSSVASGRPGGSTGNTHVPVDGSMVVRIPVKIQVFLVFYFVEERERESVSEQNSMTIGELRECCTNLSY